MDNLFAVYAETGMIYLYDDYNLAKAKAHFEHKYMKVADIDRYIKIIPRNGNHFKIRKNYNGEIL